MQQGRGRKCVEERKGREGEGSSARTDPRHACAHERMRSMQNFLKILARIYGMNTHDLLEKMIEDFVQVNGAGV